MIDQSRLKELFDDFGEDDLAELIDDVLQEAEGSITALEAEISDEHSKSRSALFHFARGCALNIGATEFAELCGHFENRHGGFSAEEYRSVKSAFDAVCGYFRDGDVLRNVA